MNSTFVIGFANVYCVEHTEDCFSVLTNRLIKFPQDTLYVLKYDKLMNDKDFQQLVLSGIKTELPYRGSDEERNTLYQYLESITTDKEYGQIASDILGEQAENLSLIHI